MTFLRDVYFYFNHRTFKNYTYVQKEKSFYHKIQKKYLNHFFIENTKKNILLDLHGEK